MTAAVSDVQEVSRRHCDPKRNVELSISSGAIIATEAGDTGPRDGGDDPVPIDAADPMVVRIGEVKVPNQCGAPR
jgi:hypothetical protein